MEKNDLDRCRSVSDGNPENRSDWISVMDRRWWWSFATVAVLSYGVAVFASSAGPSQPEDAYPPPRATLNVLYCYSCGYRKVFDEYAGIIQQKYPEISVYGANYNPPGIKMLLSRLLAAGKMLLIFFIISNTQIFAYFNRPTPSWWTWCTENKLYACMMLFFLSNTIEAQLVSSGAFEISLNDIPVWSKLDSGRMPNPTELFTIIENNLNLSKDYTL